jgi:hypothetical protein
MRVRRALVPLLAVAAFTIACGDPPDKEIQQAQAAIAAAKSAGADQYATDDYAAAQTALKQAGEAVDQRDYRLALNHALDAREHALSAAKDAAERKAAARVDSDKAVARAAAALGEARARLKSAEAAHAPPKVLADARHTIAGVEQAVQKARTDREQEDYLAALDSVKDVTPRLQAVARELESASPAVPHKRH